MRAREIKATAAACAMVAGMLFLFGLIVDDLTLRLIAKPIPVLVMAGWVALSRVDRIGKVVAAGLVSCAVGDVLLELRHIPMMFVAGMVAFLLGHIAYTIVFTWMAPRLRLWNVIPFAVLGVWMVSTVWDGMGPIRIPVMCYVAAIVVMQWRAASLAASSGSPWAWVAMLGALSYAFSDSLIALNKFHASIEGVRVPIILTYWAAQVCISAATLKLVATPSISSSESARGVAHLEPSEQ